MRFHSSLVMIAIGGLAACSSNQLQHARAAIAVQPTVLDFGAVSPGQVVKKTLTIESQGVSPLRVTALSLPQGGGNVFATDPPPAAIPPSGSATITVTLTAPVDQGVLNSNLVIFSNADNAPQLAVSLTAQVEPACALATCDTYATCSAADGMAVCTCNKGYSGDGTTCAPINACQSNNGGCDTHATCTMTGPGTASCQCQSGYTGDGMTCMPVDPCSMNNGGCDLNATCLMTGSGTSSCTCKPGYQGDGTTCTAINSCLTNNGGCTGNTMCVSTGPGTNTCQCVAQQESCSNGLDDDCDGQTDEAFDAVGSPTQVSTGGCDAYQPQILWTGSEFVILYTECVSSSIPRSMYLQAFSPTGALLGSPWELASDGTRGWLAWTGTEVAALFLQNQQQANAANILALLPPSLTTSSNLTVSSNGTTGYLDGDFAWNGNGYGFVYTNAKFQALNSSGGASGSAVALSQASGVQESGPQIAWTGSGYGVAWHSTRDYPPSTIRNRIYFQQVSASGTLVGNNVALTSERFPFGCCFGFTTHTLVWNGSEFGLTSFNTSDGYGLTLVSASGAVLAPEVALTSTNAGSSPGLTWAASVQEWIPSWSGSGSGNHGGAARVSKTGVVMGQPYAFPSGGGVVSAWNGSQLGVAWAAPDAQGVDQIYFQLLNRDCQ